MSSSSCSSVTHMLALIRWVSLLTQAVQGPPSTPAVCNWCTIGAIHLASLKDSSQHHVPACLQEYELNLTVEPSTNIEEEAEPMES